MNINFLPTKIIKALDGVDFGALKEIRFRLGYPIVLNFGLKTCYLSEVGGTLLSEKGIICDTSIINEIISNVTERSIYSHNEKIKQGYLIYSDGIRVGLAGECVVDNGQVVTVKNITSLNVRLSRMVSGCAKDVIKYLIKDNKVENTLIVSPAGFGKTTMLKDLAIYIDKLNIGSLLIIDERGEFQSVSGVNMDKIQYSDKLYSFTYGIRSMSPKFVMTDELVSECDWQCVKCASDSGVNIIASCHARSLEDIKSKKYFIKDVFSRYVILDENIVGKVKNIYDKEYSIIL